MIITVIVLAAGMSKRMGKPKLMLDWGGKKVIEQVIQNYLDAGLSQCLIISGKYHKEIKKLIFPENVKIVFNRDFRNGQMTTSLQVGIEQIRDVSDAVMVALGDQPFLKPETINKVLEDYLVNPSSILFPSINHRRGHPWIVGKEYFQEILDMKLPYTLRDFVRAHEPDIRYSIVSDPSILLDLDTPEDYERLKPNGSIQ